MNAAHQQTSTNGSSILGNTMPGTQLYQYFSTKKRGLISVRSTGCTYLKTMERDWRLLAIKKDAHTLEEWTRRKTGDFKSTLQGWQFNVTELPTMEELDRWVFDGVCDSVTGDSVEPDGHGPDGAPSWLLALGLV